MTIKLVFAASPKHTAVGSYSKDGLDQNQEMCLNVFRGEAANTNFIVIGLNRQGLKLNIYCT
jgi:hypothetical protein